MMTPRQVVKVDYEHRTCCPRLGGQVVLTLACGHIKRMKASQAPVAKTHCPECERLRAEKGMGQG